MTIYRSSVLVILVIATLSATKCDLTDAMEAINEVTPKNILVVFDPYVSILDKGNLFRYSVPDLVPLVGTVATRFNKILVQLSESDLENDTPTSLSLSPLAAAQYNSLARVTSGKTLQVWLSYASKISDNDFLQDDYTFHRNPQQVLDRMLSIAQNTNAVFNGTVTTILLPYRLILNDIHRFHSSKQTIRRQMSNASLEWGIAFESEQYSAHERFKKHVSLLQPDIVVSQLPPLSLDSQLLEYFDANLDHVQKFTKPKMRRGFFLTAPDTDAKGNVNISHMTTVWNRTIKWAEDNGTTVIISSAFDKPGAYAVGRKTNGWWRLVENAFYKTTSDFIFEEKASIIMSDSGNLSHAFSELEVLRDKNDHLEIVFSLSDKAQTNKPLKYTPEETHLLLEKILAQFSAVVILAYDDSREVFRLLGEELNRIGKLPVGMLEVTWMFMPNVYLSNILNGPREVFQEVKHDYLDLIKPITSYVISYMGNATIEAVNFLKYNALSGFGIFEDEYRFGYSFNVSICTTFSILSIDEAMLIDGFIKSNDVHTIIFYFEEDEETVKLGADRMFHQRIVILEECRRMISARRNMSNLKLSFMMLHYATNFDFYQSRRNMAQFIEYWQRLGYWAVETNSTIILNSAIDGYRYFKNKDHFETEIGWWRYDNSKDTVGKKNTLNINRNVWIDKIEEFKLRFPDSNNSMTPAGTVILETYHVILISVMSLIILVVIVCATVILIKRKFHKEYLQFLPKSEIHDFFMGKKLHMTDGDQISAVSIPYDKDRYEIVSGLYYVQEDRVLGAGEFGQVMCGNIRRNGVHVRAAVKTTNPSKTQKYVVSGLLSEIKVLSYIGKHENIIELLGANTQDIKLGKIHIFLELCELGSLQSHLRRMRPPENDYYCELGKSQDLKFDFGERVDLYLERVSGAVKLDDDLSEDLYRWSRDICSGMAYLASKHVVHADLATRNVLLNSKKEAKICDFGLSRRMYNYTNYVKQQQEPLPWKWMSPEALRNLEFSEKSDVWSYGVTLWEIYSLAEQPYPGLSWHIKFPGMLEGGLQMCEPKYNAQNMYWTMKECWQINPQRRPTFADLITYFN